MARKDVVQLHVEFLRELHVFGEGDDRTIVAIVVEDPDNNGAAIKIKGRAAFDAFDAHGRYIIRGHWNINPQYGRQFLFESKMRDTPVGKRAVTQYLSRLPGIGDGLAERLWDIHGDKAVEVLRLNPRLASTTTRGLRFEIAEHASTVLVSMMVNERALMELYQLLDGCGIPEKVKDKLCRDHGLHAAEAVRKNPYILMKYSGVGFLTADRIYLDLGGDPANPERQAYCLQHAIDVTTGDVWVSSGKVYDSLRKSISSGKPDYDVAVREAKKLRMVEVIQRDDQELLSTPERASQERQLAARIAKLNSGPSDWPDLSNDIKLYDDQKSIITAGLKNKFTCLTGTPGSGKSFTLSRVVNALRREIDCGNVAICAPTGKAAVRIMEIMQGHGLEIRATTTHSLLKARKNHNGWTPEYDEFNPLPAKYLFLEESSMTDLWGMNVLFNALRNDTNVMLVGDVNQLAPVGCGAPLRDILRSKVIHNAELTIPRRNNGKIVQVCDEIRQSGVYRPGNKIDLKNGDNLMHINASTPEQQLSALEQMLRSIQEAKNYDPIWNVQVLCSLNEKGDLSRARLNEIMQMILNPKGKMVANGKFRVGDKVVCGKNHWPMSVDRNASGTEKGGFVYVANGEFAEVTGEDDKGNVLMELTAPYRLVQVPVKSSKREDAKASDNEESVGLSSWELGYACTVWKFQGSQVPIAITMIDASSSANYVCDRSLIYTAISRAKDMSFTIGRKAVVDHFCTWTAINDRKTLLTELLMEEVERYGQTAG